MNNTENPSTATRVPPQSIQAEASVLGAMMIHAPAIPVVREIVAAEDFYRPAHQTIFKAICWMHDHPAKFGMVDLVTLRAAFEARGSLASIGGVEYLVALVQGVPTAANVEHYARIVKDKSRLRGAIIASSQAAQDAFEGHEDADDIIDAAKRAFDDATRAPHGKKPRSAADEVADDIADAIGGRRNSVEWPWSKITSWANPCAPGNVAVLCGDPGSGKSLLFQEAMLRWHQAGIPVAMLHLEKGRKFHMIRALAQLARCSDVTSDYWQNLNPDRAKAIAEQFRGELHSFGENVWDDPDGSITLDKIRAWIDARAQAGARIIGVDPITAAGQGDKSWDADRRFVIACQAIAGRTGSSVVLVTHPRGEKGAPSLDSMAGGRAFGRMSDVVLWLKAYNPPEPATIMHGLGDMQEEINRSVALFKTRNGAGQGISIALDFNPDTLLFSEVGRIRKPEKKGRPQ